MITLREGVNTQEDMEGWLSQLGTPDFPMSSEGVLELLEPRLVACQCEEKTVTFAFPVKEWELNPEGGLHGGIIVTGFDVSFGLLCHYFAKQQMVTTINIATNFLKPILPTDEVHYHVRIVSHGRTIISMVGEARLKRDNILAATASATFMILRKKFETLI